MIDRRSLSRYPCQLHGTIVLTGERRSVGVVNLSLDGMLARLAPPASREGLIPGARCAVRILSSDGGELLVVPATVTHAANGFVGLALTAIDRGADRMLHQLIELNLGINALARRDAPARGHAL